MNRRACLFVLMFLALGSAANAQEATPAVAPAPAAAATPAPVPAATPALVAVPAPAPAVGSATPLPAGSSSELKMSLTTLELLREKGLISQAEYDSALADLVELGQRAKSENTFLIGKFATTLYGFGEADIIRDSTRSYTETAGSNAIAVPGTSNGDLGRTIFSIRNSRIGFRLQAPEFYSIRSSALLEMDFFGNQPTKVPDVTGGGTESSFFNNPTFRVRHALVKMETPFVDVWAGQTWELVGWQSGFQPNTVAIQGVPGELYSRTAQLRLVRALTLGPTSLEIAVAALRPPQMDSGVPDLQGGLKLNVNVLKGVHTVGQTGTGIFPASIAITGGTRYFRLPVDDFNGTPPTSSVTGHVIAADLLVPIIPANERGAWALTFLAEASQSTGYADLYQSLTGGAGVGTPLGNSATTYGTIADVDPGLVGWQNTAGGPLGTVDWRSLIVSAQLYLPPSGKLWVSGAYSNLFSDNVGNFGAAKTTWNHEMWWDANVFFDATQALRFGLEYSNFTQVYVSKTEATDQRVQFSTWFIF